jgi:hypothetical protein
LIATLKGVGKTGFLKEFFAAHPGAGQAAVDAAWREAGDEETLRKARRILVRSHEE